MKKRKHTITSTLLLIFLFPLGLLPMSSGYAQNNTQENSTQENNTISQEINENNTQNTPPPIIKQWYEDLDRSNGLLAKFHFGDKSLIVDLLYENMPLSVMYFVGLASGIFVKEEYVQENKDTTITQDSLNQKNEDTTITQDTDQLLLPDAITNSRIDPYLYNGTTVSSFTPSHSIYANIRDDSPTEYRQYSFQQEKYFNAISYSGKGFLALHGPASASLSSSRLVFILSDIEFYSLPVSIIGSILSGLDSFDTDALPQIDAVEIKALDENAENFLLSITKENFYKHAEENNQFFISQKTEKINAIKQQLSNTSYRYSTDGLYFEFREGQLVDNIAKLSLTNYDSNELLDVLNKNPIDISQLENTQQKKSTPIFFDYSIRIYGNQKTQSYIDNSFNRENSMTYIEGTEKIIKGLEHVLTLMSPKQKLSAIIPPSLAYGDNGLGKLVRASDFLELEISMLDEARGTPKNLIVDNAPKDKPKKAKKSKKEKRKVTPTFKNKIDDEIDEEIDEDEFPYLK